MSKSRLVKEISEATGLTNVDSEKALEAVLDGIKNILGNGDDLCIRGFGTFRVKSKPARMGRNPKTGEPAPIKARTVVSFKAGGKLKEKVDN